MKSQDLTNTQETKQKIDKELIESTYSKPLENLVEAYKDNKSLTAAQKQEGIELVTEYYSYLAEHGIKYGKVALAVFKKEGFIGKMTDLHLERQLQFEGVSDIARTV